MKQLFFEVCRNCHEESVKEEKPYKGLVNLQVDKLPNGITRLYYQCFTCKTDQELLMNPRKPEDVAPISGEQMIRNRDKRFKETKES